MKTQSSRLMTAVAFGALLGAYGCGSSGTTPSTGGSTSTGGSAKTGGTTSNGGSTNTGGGTSTTGGTKTGGVTNTGGTTATGGAKTGGTTSGTGGTTVVTCDSATNVTPCGGDLTGDWTAAPVCLKVSGNLDITALGLGCRSGKMTGALQVSGGFTVGADKKFKDNTTTTGTLNITLEAGCLEISGTKTDCDGLALTLQQTMGYTTLKCPSSASGGCDCTATLNQKGTMGRANSDPQTSGTLSTANNQVVMGTDLLSGDDLAYDYCVAGNKLSITPKTTSPITTGTIVFTKGGTPGTGGNTATGGSVTPTGGSRTGGTAAGGLANTGGTSSGGVVTTGGSGATGGTTGGTGGVVTATGGTGPSTTGERPCDIYKAANTPCVVAYSMVRSLSKSYTGPLYQVRKDSNNKNTGTGGTTKDIGQTADGYADTAAQDAFCGTTYCTVSLLYDHSGNDNNISSAPKGNTAGGANGALDDYESIATKGAITAGGHKVYSLYMNAVEGYRSQKGEKGKNMPTGSASQGVYELADGTHAGTACCWDFGNVTPDPTQYAFMNTLFFGVAYWGKGAGSGPWFGADFEGGVWMGGTKVTDPGYGGLNEGTNNRVNPNNPSLKVPFAFGILKVSSTTYALRMADLATASALTTAYEGGIPEKVRVDNKGAIVLGVGGDNSNNSFGTFYEGAITAGFPTAATDLAVFNNVKAVGYSK